MKKKYATIEEQQEARRLANSRYQQSLKDIRTKHHFIAWDGEGFNVSGLHRYGLLMNSESELMFNFNGLSSIDCLNMLCDNAMGYLGEKSIHVCFSANYDVNMMLKGSNYDIPEAQLKELYKGERIVWNNFSLEWRPRKSFTVARFKPGKRFLKNEKGEWVPQFDAKLILWDVFGFFQCSFLRALETFFSKEELEELGYLQIKEGKDRRSSFNPQELRSFIIPYTTLEVKALVKLMDRLDGYCKQATIYLKRWDGAGAVAAAILDKHSIKKYYGDIPPELEIPSQHAYGGGRNEMIQYGYYNGDIYHADIVSAYPAVLEYLPDLSSGQWQHFIGSDVVVPANECFSLYKIKWQFPLNHPFYPFFYRDIFGQITYPSHGVNWVWWPELDKFYKWNHILQGKLNIYEQWLYTPGSDKKPYSFIRDYFEKKKLYKAQGNGVYIVFKLGPNSVYGKTVQHLGYDEEKGRKPPYFQLQYGGYITSKTRASLFDAAMSSGNGIIAMATDGLWSTEPIGNIKIGDDLGEWEHEILRDGTFVQSGVYWATKSDGTKVQHYRGFDRDNLTEGKVHDAWRTGKTSVDVECTRFVTLGTALSSYDRFHYYWCQWDKNNRKLVVHPCEGRKRDNIFRWTPQDNPSLHLFRTYSKSEEGQVAFMQNEISYPFPLPWSRRDYEEFKRGNRENDEYEREIEESQGYPGDFL